MRGTPVLACLLWACSGAALAADSSFVADYLRGLDSDLLLADLNRPSTRQGQLAPLDLSKAQARYNLALRTATTPALRTALTLHWAQMQSCVDMQTKAARAEAVDHLESIEWQARADQCKIGLNARAADIRASAASVAPPPRKKK